ncbi:MAG TPA: ABC transporter ATP-binding protein [Xanthobacteraceae bacterium]|nr:ABC transporter ATP-binding protein [Xanthobacteraceae bacterium]
MNAARPIKAIADALPIKTALVSPRQPLLRLTGLEKTFTSGTVALAGVDLTILPGEFVSLLGPSGCGKSTLLKMIAALAVPSSGTIEWPQSPHDAAGAAEPALSFVFQEPTLLPWRTAAENIRLPLLLAGTDKKEARERVREALELVGLSAFADQHPRQLSGGMKMRVSIARALVTRPRILLMDEPFAALDEITRNKLNDDLLELFARQRLTVIFVTHSVYESVYLSNRIVVMSSRPGRVTGEIPVEASYPRDEEFRTSAIYNERCRLVSTALRLAIGIGDCGR